MCRLLFVNCCSVLVGCCLLPVVVGPVVVVGIMCNVCCVLIVVCWLSCVGSCSLFVACCVMCDVC